MNQSQNNPTPGNESVGDQNVQRLLQAAYDPERPSEDFIGAMRDRLAEEARSLESAQQTSPRPTASSRSRWLSTVAIAAGSALTVAIVLTLLNAPKKEQQDNESPRVYHDGPLIWVDGKPYVPSEAESPGDDDPTLVSPAAFEPKQSVPKQREPVEAAGLSPRKRDAPPAATPLDVGDSIVTDAGQRRHATLPDGSVLYVNENTAVRIEEDRRISLESGEVFLEVAARDPQSEDDEATFHVATPDRDVEALGTKFAVQANSLGTVLTVTQGRVRVSDVDQTVDSGQQLIPVVAGDDPVKSYAIESAPRASEQLAWTKDLIAASESPLVPGSEFAGGAIVSIDPNGQEVYLELRRQHIDVHIEDGFARTTIDQTYFNHNSFRLEGTFYFPLPPDASLSRLAMYVGGKLMEGGMAERDHARNVFETIKHRSLDPALLEWVDGSTFKMRVFPLEGREEKRIVLSYTQKVDNNYGRLRYRFPAGHNLIGIRNWSATVHVRHGADLEWKCDSHVFKATTPDGNLTLTAAMQGVTPDHDIVLELRDKEVVEQANRATFSTAEHEQSKYVMLRYRPELKSETKTKRRDWIFLFESSGDRNPVLARVQADVITTLLENAEHDDTFTILTTGTRISALSKERLAVTPANLKKAAEFLDDTHLIGALNLEQALRATEPFAKAAKNPVLVHVGSGVPVLGEKGQEELLELLPAKTRYVGVGVGKRWNRALMKAAASHTGGHFTQINPDESTKWRSFELLATLNTPRLLNVRVSNKDDARNFLLINDSLAHGEELCAITRFDEGQKLPEQLTITGQVDGGEFWQEVKVENVAGDANYLPRIWAKLEIDRLLADGAVANKDKIIGLSNAMYVMSPFTSLLVLETEEMYREFKVDRGRKDHWALYPCPERIEVIREPLIGPLPDDAPKEKPDRKPTPRELLETLLVHTGGQGYTNADTLFYGARRGNGFGFDAPDELLSPEILARSGFPPRATGFGASGADFNSLIELIQSTIAPSQWDEVGGPGSITPFDSNLSLVISQTQEVHEQIDDILAGGWQYDWGHSLEYLLQRDGSVRTTDVDAAPPLVDLNSFGEFPEAAVWHSLDDGVSLARAGGPMAKIRAALNEQSQCDFVETPLEDAMEYFEDLHGVRIELDALALARAGMPVNARVTFEVNGVSFRSMLRLLLKRLGLGYVVQDDVIMITSVDAIRRARETGAPLSFDYPPSVNSQRSSIGEVYDPVTERWLIDHWANRIQQGDAQRFVLYAPWEMPNAWMLRNLMFYAPAINTTRSDALAVLASKTQAGVVGKIDDRARALVERHRGAGWQSVTLADQRLNDLPLLIDGRGRLRGERRTRFGLHEVMVCDGQQLLHLYPELGLGARRDLSHFHRRELRKFAPWLLPPVEELARNADLRMIDDRVVAVVPHGRDARSRGYQRLHLMFDADGRLAERRVVEIPSGKTMRREVYAADGAVRQFDENDELVAQRRFRISPAEEPDLKPSLDDLVVLPMPIRSREHVADSLKLGEDFFLNELSEEDALRLIAADHWDSSDEMQDVIDMRFFARGDRRLGFYTLMLSTGGWWGHGAYNEYTQKHNALRRKVLADHPDSPLAKYIASESQKEEDSDAAEQLIEAGGGHFASLLSEYRNLYWQTKPEAFEKLSDDARLKVIDAIMDFARRGDAPGFAALLLRRVQDLTGKDQPRHLIAKALDGLEAKGELNYVARYELAKAFAAAGERGAARAMFLDLYRKMRQFGELPLIDAAFCRTFRDLDVKYEEQDDRADPFGDPSDPFADVAEDADSNDDADLQTDDYRTMVRLLRETCLDLVEQRRHGDAITLVWQCHLSGEKSLARDLLQIVISDVPDQEYATTTLRAIDFLAHSGNQAWADRLLRRLLAAEETKDSPSLWRLAAWLAHRRGQLASSVERHEHALDLEFQRLSKTVNIEVVRNEYRQLLSRYEKLAAAFETVGQDASPALTPRVVRMADRWRALDSDPTDACMAAAKVLQQLGQNELAWDYLTTPLSLKPNEAAPWLAIAASLRDSGSVELASRAYAAAFAAEETNAHILYEHARLLRRNGRLEQAREIDRQLADGQWQPRFQWIQRDAQSRLAEE